MTKVYNKLVRDRIPEIIASTGDKYKIRTLSDAEYIEMLDEKLDEELKEYHEDKNIEELADILEVLYAVAKARGYSKEALEETRLKKREKRGGFEKKILLIETIRDQQEV
ncbi:MAG: phosphoribosyl-ATP pyrophosphohydrolase [Clostridiales bacterium]|nr:phosphoribosyl-ATP pyrophosphohydrolase [Clostridiales bacterium]